MAEDGTGIDGDDGDRGDGRLKDSRASRRVARRGEEAYKEKSR